MLRYLLSIFFLINLQASDNPNIIIILTDDLGWGDVSYNGGPISTPNIDKLARDGVQMNRFYAAPTCSPTRAALMTGINSLENGVIRPFDNPTADRYGLPLRYKIMPEYLKDAGYQTALSGKWHLGMFSDEYLPLNRGFDSTYGHLGGGIGYFDHALSGRMDWHRNGEVLHEDGYSTTLIANEAIRLIENVDESTPIFLYVAFNAPHTPIEAEEKFIKELSHIQDKKERVYAANIMTLDFEIGNIMNAIESKGILEETIIIFFSDNGPVYDVDPIAATIASDVVDSKGNTLGLRGSKGSAYEGGIRVPAIIYYKGVLDDAISNQFIFVDDILPTILSALNIKSNSGTFTGNDHWINLITNNVVLPKNSITGNVIVNDERALFNDKWKLYYRKFIYDNESEEIFELYDILNDPYENFDLSIKHPEILESMKKTFYDKPINLETPFFNPVHSYLHGDKYIGINNSPWLERNYEEKDPPHPIIQNIIFTWIVFLTFKEFIIPIIFMIFILIGIYFYKKKSNFS
tara:strand:+ start:2352 stop:3911 length:1560 start_codon:yes stop_codon:yes gene_type:complete